MTKARGTRYAVQGTWYTVQAMSTTGRRFTFEVYGTSRQHVMQFLVYDAIIKGEYTDYIVLKVNGKSVTQKEVNEMCDSLTECNGICKDAVELIALCNIYSKAV